MGKKVFKKVRLGKAICFEIPSEIVREAQLKPRKVVYFSESEDGEKVVVHFEEPDVVDVIPAKIKKVGEKLKLRVPSEFEDCVAFLHDSVKISYEVEGNCFEICPKLKGPEEDIA